MTFLHKLAQRLARMKTPILMGVLVTSACEQIPAAGPTGTQQPVVVASVASVSVTPGAVSATTGQTVQLTAIPRDAIGRPLLGRTVTWRSSNPAVVTVGASGLATGVPAGSATITATSEGKSGTAAITVTLTPAPVASVSVSPATPSMTTGQRLQLTATLQDASGNVLIGRGGSITWGSSDTGVAIVNVSGLVTGVAVGAAAIMATSGGKIGTTALSVSAAGSFAPPNIASADFQDGTIGGFSYPWDPSRMQVVNDPTGAGLGKVCRIQYTVSDVGEGAPYYAQDSNAGLMKIWAQDGSDNITELYARVYVYIPDQGYAIEYGLSGGPPQRKIIYFNPLPGVWKTVAIRHFEGVSGPGTVGLRLQTQSEVPTVVQTQLSGFFDWALDTWYYVEMHVKLNTIGQNNGTVQVWAGPMGAPGLADMLWVDLQNIDVRGTDTKSILTAGIGYQLNKVGYGGWSESRYLKNAALSTQRIGP
jgi:uncharacterized protein YjdB